MNGMYTFTIHKQQISFEFTKNDFNVINNYKLKQKFQSYLSAYSFDDWVANAMTEVLISRYEQFVENNSITNFASNLSASEIFYGNRLRSRMRQMFNLISFDKETTDK